MYPDGKWKWKSFSHVWLFATSWTIQSMEFSRSESGVGSLSLLQGSFPTQGSNPGLLHCRWILYQLSHREAWLLFPSSDSVFLTVESYELLGVFSSVWKRSLYSIFIWHFLTSSPGKLCKSKGKTDNFLYVSFVMAENTLSTHSRLTSAGETSSAQPAAEGLCVWTYGCLSFFGVNS